MPDESVPAGRQYPPHVQSPDEAVAVNANPPPVRTERHLPDTPVRPAAPALPDVSRHPTATNNGTLTSPDPIDDMLRALATLHAELTPLAESAHVRMPGLLGGPDAFLTLLTQLPEPELSAARAAFQRADDDIRPLLATLKPPESEAGP